MCGSHGSSGVLPAHVYRIHRKANCCLWSGWLPGPISSGKHLMSVPSEESRFVVVFSGGDGLYVYHTDARKCRLSNFLLGRFFPRTCRKK